MREICNKCRVKQVSERRYPANFIKTDEFINLPTRFGKSLIYQALPLVCDTALSLGLEHVLHRCFGRSHFSNTFKLPKRSCDCSVIANLRSRKTCFSFPRKPHQFSGWLYTFFYSRSSYKTSYFLGALTLLPA